MSKHKLELIALEECGTQPYFSNVVQLMDIVDWILDQTGPADIMISTFSTSEEFVRRLWRMKARGRVLSCSMFCDLRAARKTAGLYTFIRNVFDAVALCENHSKALLITNSSHCVAVVTSQNQTRGDRYECGIITTDHHTIVKLREGFDALAEKSLPIERLIFD